MKPNEFFKKYWIELLLIAAWLIANLVTAGFSELYEDEAYYWAYSKRLDWGYWDHPPMIALMIKAGYAIFHNELGVRLLSIILTTSSLVIMYLLTDKKQPLLFGLLAFSVFALNLIAFMALPDNFLLFFIAVFFWFYKKYTEKENWWIVAGMAITIALMMYSKYHGILVVGFTVLSNLKILLKKKSFYLIVAVSILLFLPHILWQVNNDFPSIRYHMVDRNSDFNILRPLGYILTQVVFYGPLITLVLLPLGFIYKPVSKLEKALKWNFIGALAFFLVSTLKGRVESNWTLTIIFPMLVFGVHFCNDRKKIKKVLIGLAIPSVIIGLLARALIIHPVEATKDSRLGEFTGRKAFTKEILEKVDGVPLTTYSYQIASLLSFYSGQDVTALSIGRRKSQYDIWKNEEPLLWKKVAFVNTYFRNDIQINALDSNYYVTFTDSLTPIRFLEAIPDTNFYTAKANENILIDMQLTPTKMEHFNGHNIEKAMWIRFEVYQEDSAKRLKKVICKFKNKHIFTDEKFQAVVPPFKNPGNYILKLTIGTKDIGFYDTGKRIRLHIK